MISNSRQLKITKQRMADLRQELQVIQGTSGSRSIERLIADLEAEVTEYEALESGLIARLDIGSLDSLGEALVKARILRGWTQQQLADEMGWSSQTTQKDEARYYENCGLARMAEILDALDFQLVGELIRTDDARVMHIVWSGETISNATSAASASSYSDPISTFASIPTASNTNMTVTTVGSSSNVRVPLTPANFHAWGWSPDQGGDITPGSKFSVLQTRVGA